MTISLIEFFTRLSRDLHEEDYTFASGNWTPEEIIGYLNYAERDFLKCTGIQQTDVSVAADGSTLLFDRPANTMDLNRMAFNGKRLFRQTSHDLELEDRNWRVNSVGNPSYWHEDHLSVTQYELNKIPAAGGTIRIFADYIFDEYESYVEDFHLRDCWEVYLRWKVLSLCLAKDGENKDLGRSKYANQRYQVGVLLARRLIQGNATLNMQR